MLMHHDEIGDIAVKFVMMKFTSVELIYIIMIILIQGRQGDELQTFFCGVLLAYALLLG
jgi:hypothetical protein